MFALGAMQSILDGELAKRLRGVSSVSGGSIVNAAYALTNGFPDAEFSRGTTQRLARAIARYGAFPLRRRGEAALILVGACLLIGIVAFIAAFVAAFAQSGRLSIALVVVTTPSAIGLLLTTTMTGGLAFVLWAAGVYWFPRKRLQIRSYEKLLAFAIGSGDLGWCSMALRDQAKRVRAVRMSGLPAGNVEHIFCSTDVVSGGPAFASRRGLFVGSEESNCDLYLAEALYASAAFPALYAPLTPKARGEHNIRLTDGGVFNNLGNHATFADHDNLALRFVVNSSKPVKPDVRWRLKFLFPSSVRALGLIQGRVVRLLLESVKSERSVAVVDIGETPQMLLKRLSEHCDPAVRARAAAVEPEPGDESDASSRIGTKLEALGSEAVQNLFGHGYRSTAIAAHCLFGVALRSFDPESLRLN